MENNIIYFDNSASTKVRKEAIDILVKVMEDDYANPSAKHKGGMQAENYIKESAKIIAKTLKVEEKEIVFTSGGTESNNMALIGTALANKKRGKHIITTGIEHPAVHKPLLFLEENGFELTVLPVNKDGKISLDDLKNAIRKDTILVSTMYVNNEIRAIEPVEEISKLIKSINEDIIYHVDAIQAYTKLKIEPKKQGIDLLSVSGHKLHAPKGVGFLYINKKIKCSPIILGGGQQAGMRAGTINVNGIAALGEAIKYDFKDFDEKLEKIKNIKDYISKEILKIEGTKLNSKLGYESAVQIVSASFKDIRAEVLLHALEEKGIYVSSGSACSSNHPGISGTLKGIGLENEYLDSTIRISLSEFSTMDEAKYLIDILLSIVPTLRKFVRK